MSRKRSIDTLVYYDDQMMPHPSLSVVFMSAAIVTVKLSARCTYEKLRTMILAKVTHGRGQTVDSVKYQLPTSFEPLKYSIFHLSNDADVEMMIETHILNSNYSIQIII